MPKRQAKPPRITRWEKPGEGWTKVNTDGGFDALTYTGRAGVVIRDHHGGVLSAAARWFEDIPDAITAEALAALEGLELAVETGCEKVILEVDSSQLQVLLQSEAGKQSSVGGLCFDIIEHSKSFREFKVVWVSREANSVADHCAQFVSATERSIFWFDDIPGWLQGLVDNDCNPVND